MVFVYYARHVALYEMIMADKPPSRRDLLKLALAAATIPQAKAEEPDPRLYHIRIPDDQAAINLLKAKMDQAIFKNPKVMTGVLKRAPIYIPPGTGFIAEKVICHYAHKQIENAVREFKESSPPEAMTPESLFHHYRDYVSAFFHKHYAPQYAAFLSQHPEARDAGKREVAEKQKFGEIVKAIGCSMWEQLGCDNPNWQSTPLPVRPLDFDHIFKDIGVTRSPFIINARDLAEARIDVKKGLEELSTHASLKPERGGWAERAEIGDQPRGHERL